MTGLIEGERRKKVEERRKKAEGKKEDEEKLREKEILIQRFFLEISKN